MKNYRLQTVLLGLVIMSFFPSLKIQAADTVILNNTTLQDDLVSRTRGTAIESKSRRRPSIEYTIDDLSSFTCEESDLVTLRLDLCELSAYHIFDNCVGAGTREDEETFHRCFRTLIGNKSRCRDAFGTLD